MYINEALSTSLPIQRVISEVYSVYKSQCEFLSKSGSGSNLCLPFSFSLGLSLSLSSQRKSKGTHQTDRSALMCAVDGLETSGLVVGVSRELDDWALRCL